MQLVLFMTDYFMQVSDRKLSLPSCNVYKSIGGGLKHVIVGGFFHEMTTEEAFVKVLQMHGIEHAFGIIGSAMMPISDLFPQAGITFWDAAHECNAGMMADGFTRASGKMSMMVAQNGPGITNFVTPVKTAYWNHTPLLLVTPQAANKTIGQGGFQEVEQMALFKDMVAYQEEVRDASRIAEVLNRVIMQAKACICTCSNQCAS